MRTCFLISFLFVATLAGAQEITVRVRALEQKVNDFYRRGEFSRSLDFADSLLKLSPANLNYLTLCYETSLAELKDTARAVAYLKMIVTAHPFEADYVDQYGWAMLKEKNIPKALEFTTRAYQLDREDLPGLLNYAHALYLSGQTGEAMKVYAEAEQITYSKNMFLRNQQQDFMILHSLYPKAGFEQLAVTVNESFEKSAETYAAANLAAYITDSLTDNNASSSVLIGQYQNAVDSELEAFPLRPKLLSRYYGFLGSYYMQTADKRSGVKYLQAGIAQDNILLNYSVLGRRHQMLGDLNKESGNTDSAVGFYQQAVRYYHLASNPVNVARSYFQLISTGNSAVTTQFIKDSIQAVMEKYNVHDDLINVYELLASRHQADGADSQKLFLERALYVVHMNSLSEKLLVSIYRQLGWIAIQEGDYVKAEDYFLKAVTQISVSEKKSVRGFQSRWDLGELYYRKGELERAKDLLNESIDILFAIRKELDRTTKEGIVSNQPNAFTTLKEVYSKLDDPEAAKKVAELSRSFLLSE